MGKDYSQVKNFIFICNGSDCKKSGAKDLEKAVHFELKTRGQKNKSKIIKTKCTGRCKEAPVVLANNQWLSRVRLKEVREIVDDVLDKE